MFRGLCARVVAAGLAAGAGTAVANPTMTFSSDPHPGIHRETWEDSSVPWRTRIIQIDLTSAEIAVYATKESDRGLTPTAYAARIGAQVVVNGDAFSVDNFVPRGLAIGASDVWSNTADDDISAVFDVRRVGERTIAEIEPPAQITTAATLPTGTEGAVSGRPLIVSAGAVPNNLDCTDQVTLACQRTPRTAVALSADGNTMWLAVTDGWQSGSTGMTAAELGAFLAARGAYNAVLLDGGSSSALNVDGALISSPSDGVERAVANHIAVKFGSLPKGQLVGLICKHDVIGCSGDTTREMTGVKVYLDDTREFTTSTTAYLYDFTNVTQRLACVTAKKTGYLTKTQCAQVNGDGITYNSIAMFEGKDTPDAGVGDDGGTDVPDAGTGGHGDAGNPATGQGNGAGCCEAGRSRPSWPLVVVVAWFLTRRRGTTR
ncbi:MAG: phosphodiester glycosidase family protein [Kofleriaceae bacterium]